VFAYGSLCFPQLVEALLGLSVQPEPARLEGWERVGVRGASYPGLRAATGASTEGVLYRILGAEELAQLDAFEGELYERRSLTVQAGGGAVAAEVWVVRPSLLHRLGDEPWSPDGFASAHLHEWVRHGAELRAAWRSGR